jgi:hypothetical protein
MDLFFMQTTQKPKLVPNDEILIKEPISGFKHTMSLFPTKKKKYMWLHCLQAPFFSLDIFLSIVCYYTNVRK